mgnify:CR=1 FL=1
MEIVISDIHRVVTVRANPRPAQIILISGVFHLRMPPPTPVADHLPNRGGGFLKVQRPQLTYIYKKRFFFVNLEILDVIYLWVPMEFGTHILRFRSTHAYYKFTKFEYLSPPQCGDTLHFVIFWNQITPNSGVIPGRTNFKPLWRNSEKLAACSPVCISMHIGSMQ